MKSFFSTCFNLDKLQCHSYTESGLLQVDSFHYLTFYYERNKDLFIQILSEIAIEENCTIYFIDALLLIFKSLYDINESVNILKLLIEGMNNNDKKAAFFYCVLTMYYKRVDPDRINQVNYNEVLKILENLSNEGNVFASERLGLILDSTKEYNKAFEYFRRSSKYFLPKSLRLLGIYYCSNRNPFKKLDLKKGIDLSEQAYYVGGLGGILLLNLKLNKNWEHLRILSQISFDMNQYGAEYFLGKIYEKGLGVNQDLEIAMSIFIRALTDKRNLFFSLFEVARINEYEKKFHISDQLYKVVYMIHKSTFDKKEFNSENWILNGYRMASMVRKGQGVKCDKIKAQQILDELYNHRFNDSYDPITEMIINEKILKMREQNLKEILFEQEIKYLSINPIVDFKKSQLSSKINNLDDNSAIFFKSNQIEMNKLLESYEESNEIKAKIYSDYDNINISQTKEFEIGSYPRGEDLNPKIEENLIFGAVDEYYYSNGFNSQYLNKLKKDIQTIRTRVKFIDFNEIQLDTEIRNSHNSIIYTGQVFNDKIIAKEYKLNNENQILKVFDEIIIQSNLYHKNINSIKNICFGISPLRIITIHRHMTKTLRFILQKHQLNLSLKFKIAIQILEAINYLHNHSPPIVHCDLKPENILIDDTGHIEICGFGLTKVLFNDYIETYDIFTPRFSPPELIKNKMTCKGRDIWAIGLILYEIFNGVHLFEEIRINDFIEFLMNSNEVIIKNNYFTPKEVTDLIKTCLIFDPSRRSQINILLHEITRIFQFLDDSKQLF